ncbi:MAG: aminotransferase class V-fold PLP-dependent enzyme [Promethearchaeota archaeon]|nr:MAG: aminotransferase class V-fold PLP-dependent enzyme [Candidatus Lokiarchaeota archaeon]
MSVDWDNIRKTQFPALEKFTYLITAGSAPISRSAYEGGVEYFNRMLNYGDVDHELFFLDINEPRKIIAEYLNTNHENIAFMINTSSGLATIAHTLTHQKGGILYPSIEFPASVHLFKRLGFPTTRIESTNYSFPAENFKKGITENTKYCIQSHVQSFNGFRQNLEKFGKFCEEYNLINIINATQSFGAFEIDVKKDNIDFLVSSGLKNIACGWGIGILYIHEDFVDENIPFTSWLSVEDPFSMDNDNLRIYKKAFAMDSFGGCPNFAALLALKGGLELVHNVIGRGSIRTGIKEIQNRVISLTDQFFPELQDLNFKIITSLEKEYRSGIITVEHEKAKKIYRELIKNNIYITLKRYPHNKKETLLRFAINYYNNMDDLTKTIDILKKVLKKVNQ